MTELVARPVVYGKPAEFRIGAEVLMREFVKAGALKKALASERVGRVVFLRDHNPSLLLGRVNAGTLALKDTATALEARVRLPDTVLGDETAKLVDRGDLAGGSFMFLATRWSWYEDPDGVPVRVIEEIEELFDVSACTWPAYEQTSLPLARRGKARALPGCRFTVLDSSSSSATWRFRSSGSGSIA